ncbi:MAG: Holliday junction resolvase RuvX [Paracoccaceae bacterium]
MARAVTEDPAVLSGIGPLIGLDLGTKTIGVAISDGLQMTATAFETLPRGKFSKDAAKLADIVAGRTMAGVVVGLPRNMDGSEGPRAQSARAYARNVAERLDLPVLLWDERLSTVAAERALLEADTSRRRRAEVIDALAAQFILQGVLDRIAAIREADA